MSVTLRDVAIQAGVAESTASRALSGSDKISETTRIRVENAAKELGYVPRVESNRKSNVRRGLIGAVVGALHNSFYPFLIDRIHDELDSLGFDMILIIDDLFDSGHRRKIQGLIDASLDGVVFATASIHSPTVDFLVDGGVPTVLAIRSNRSNNVDVVESDNHAAGTEAIQHLLDLGHRRIGFIMGPQDTSTSIDRFNGGCREMKVNGFELTNEYVVWGNYSHDSGYSGLIHLMNQPKPPTAVFCGNDVIAIGALEACQKFGLKVPEDISIIGVDDIPMASWSMISLTTIRQSIGDIGALAARRLVARIKGGSSELPSHDILPTSIVRRRTTGPASLKPKQIYRNLNTSISN